MKLATCTDRVTLDARSKHLNLTMQSCIMCHDSVCVCVCGGGGGGGGAKSKLPYFVLPCTYIDFFLGMPI